MSQTISKARLLAFRNQNGRCFYCHFQMWRTEVVNINEFAATYGISKAEAKRFECTAEHLNPRQDGGTDARNNIVAACDFCNKARHRRRGRPVRSPAEHLEFVRRRIARGKWHPQRLHHMY